MERVLKQTERSTLIKQEDKFESFFTHKWLGIFPFLFKINRHLKKKS